MPQELSTHLCNCFTPPDHLHDDPLCYFCTVGVPSLCASTICPGCVWFYLSEGSGGSYPPICFCPCSKDPRCGGERWHGSYLTNCFLYANFCSISAALTGLAYAPFFSCALTQTITNNVFHMKDEFNGWLKTFFFLPCFYAQMMRQNYANGNAAWAPFLAGSHHSSGGKIPSRDQIISKKIEGFTQADLRFFQHKVCWQLREKLTKARISTAFEIFSVHSTVISFLPPAERDSQEVRDAADKLVGPFAKWRYHCSAIMC